MSNICYVLATFRFYFFRSWNVIIMTLRDILLLNVNQQNQNSIAEQFGLVSPQHPFILIFKEDNTKWSVIEYHIQYMFNVG